MRRIIVFAFAIVSLCMFPRFAFAAGTEQVVSDAGENVMVVAYNRFNAALLMLGVSPDDARLDATAKAKLSNASTGGRFYELVQYIEQYDGLDTDDVFGSIGFGVLRLPWVAYCLAYDMHIYTYVGARDGALEDLQTVLGGGDLGGGGGGSGGTDDDITIGDVVYTPWTGGAVDGGTYTLVGQWPNYTNPAPSQTWNLSNQSNVISGFEDVLVMSKLYSGTQYTYSMLEIKTGINVMLKKNGDSVLYLVNDTDKDITAKRKYYTYNVSPQNGVYTPNAGGNVDTYLVASHSVKTVANAGNYGSGNIAFAYYKGGGNNTPVLPPTNWPDNPVVTTPEPPDVPTDTPVYPPQVTGPDVAVPQTPDLSDVLDALNEHCEHLQDAIYNGFNDYYETITSYYSDVVDWLQEWLEYFDRVFDDAFDDIKLYQQTGNYWLNQIYNKLDDINKKLDALGNKLESDDIPSSYDDSNVATDGSSVLVGAYNNLRTKFPFSLLDSLANFATRLKHQAVAPEFDLPVGSPFDSHDPFTVEIDLTPYSDWAAIVRTGEVLAVYVALARRAAAMWTSEGEGA